jgi:hypothetical protein
MGYIYKHEDAAPFEKLQQMRDFPPGRSFVPVEKVSKAFDKICFVYYK